MSITLTFRLKKLKEKVSKIKIKQQLERYVMNKRKYSFNKSGKISKDINFFNIKKKQNRKGFPEAYFIVAKRSGIK